MSAPALLRLALVLPLSLAALGACDAPGGGAAPMADAAAAPDTDKVGDSAPAADVAPSPDAPSPDAATPDAAGPIGCGPGGPLALAACVEDERFWGELVFVAAARTPGSAHWQAVQARCAEVFAGAGLEVELHAYGSGVNVVGVKPGGAAATERVVVSAHYDHVSGCAGADDNASGTAAVLEAARALAGGSFDRTLVFACWDEEERGLIGSKAWVARAVSRGETVVASLVVEMIGFTSSEPDSQQIPPGIGLLYPDEMAWLEARDHRGDFIALIGDPGSREALTLFGQYAAAFDLPAMPLELPEELLLSPLTGDLRRSDHAPFWEAGLPAVMTGDSAEFRNPYYHCAGGPDTPATLDRAFAVKNVRTVVATAADLASD